MLSVFILEDFFTTRFGEHGELNVIDDYLKRRGWRESVPARRYLEALRDSIVSLYEVVDIVPGRRMTVRDLILGGDAVRVEEKLGSEGAAPWDRLAARVVAVNGKNARSCTGMTLLRRPPRSRRPACPHPRRAFGALGRIHLEAPPRRTAPARGARVPLARRPRQPAWPLVLPLTTTETFTMLTHPIIDKLHQLKCLGMATALTEQLQSTACEALSFEERLGLLVDRETTVRDDRRMTNRLRRAKLRHPNACEDVDFRHPRGLDKSLEHLNILITGPPANPGSPARSKTVPRLPRLARLRHRPRRRTSFAKSTSSPSTTSALTSNSSRTDTPPASPTTDREMARLPRRPHLRPAHRPSRPPTAPRESCAIPTLCLTHRRRRLAAATPADSTRSLVLSFACGRWAARAPQHPHHRTVRRRQRRLLEVTGPVADQRSPARSPIKPAATDSPRCTCDSRGCCTTSPSPAATAPIPNSSLPPSPSSTSSPSTTSASPSSMPTIAATCSNSSRTDTPPAPPWSPASSRSRNGTTASATPPSPTQSSTVSSTTPTSSNSKEDRCERRKIH